MQLPPLSLYIHYPWCAKKCPYCDFNSHQNKQNISDTHYIDALITDLNNSLKWLQGRSIESIFIGGGTPSLCVITEMERLLTTLSNTLVLNDDVEITLEANPGSAEAENFKQLYQIGVNRLSIGAQSFNTKHLHSLGRIHSANEAIRAVEKAQCAGFSNINIDVMYGLPQQSVHQALDDIKHAIALKPSHISWYQLTIEENTLFAKHPPPPVDEDSLWQMTQRGMALLTAENYPRYEVSAYGTIPCHHNINYWQFGDYLGIGAGAHGKITTPDGIVRTTKNKSPLHYLSQPTENIHQVSDVAFEFMLNALRLNDGFDKTLFEQHTRMPLSSVQSTLDHAYSLGLLRQTTKRIMPTETGYRFLNDTQALFLT